MKKGDTDGTIALNNYGTYGVWKELYNANKGAKLVVGAQLVLPERLGKTMKIVATVAAEGESLYTVKARETPLARLLRLTTAISCSTRPSMSATPTVW